MLAIVIQVKDVDDINAVVDDARTSVIVPISEALFADKEALASYFEMQGAKFFSQALVEVK